MIAEGLALIDKAMRHRRAGPYQLQAAIAALHARASTPAETDWAQIDRLYAVLERMQPSPVITLNRRSRSPRRAARPSPWPWWSRWPALWAATSTSTA
jgi:predicted RNA polymerase sigma factor